MMFVELNMSQQLVVYDCAAIASYHRWCYRFVALDIVVAVAVAAAVAVVMDEIDGIASVVVIVYPMNVVNVIDVAFVVI